MTPKIPRELHAFVLELHGKGTKSEEIAEQLWREHKVEVSSRSVRTLCKRHSDEVASQARVVVREKLRQYVMPAAAALVSAMKRARKYEREAVDRLDTELALKAQDRVTRAANLILHYVGVDQVDQVGAPGQDAGAALLQKFEKLIRERKAKTSPPADDDTPEVH